MLWVILFFINAVVASAYVLHGIKYVNTYMLAGESVSNGLYSPINMILLVLSIDLVTLLVCWHERIISAL